MLWSSLYQLVNLVFQLYIFIVVARALVSWVGPDPYNPLVRFLYRATDPVLDAATWTVPTGKNATIWWVEFEPVQAGDAEAVGRRGYAAGCRQRSPGNRV